MLKISLTHTHGVFGMILKVQSTYRRSRVKTWSTVVNLLICRKRKKKEKKKKTELLERSFLTTCPPPPSLHIHATNRLIDSQPRDSIVTTLIHHWAQPVCLPQGQPLSWFVQGVSASARNRTRRRRNRTRRRRRKNKQL